MVHTMSLSQYLEMWDRIIKWQTKNNTKTNPNYVDVTDMEVGVTLIYEKTYMDMYNRVLSYQQCHNGEMPQIIGIEGPYDGDSSQPSGNGTLKSQLEKGLGSFDNFTQFWKKILEGVTAIIITISTH